jgi:hypothetical protein
MQETLVHQSHPEIVKRLIVDLDRVWVELAISPADLPAIKANASRTNSSS